MKRIGKYIVRGLLGQGGMARIYKVEHPWIGKIAALKQLQPHPSLEALLGVENLRERFAAEARMMAGLRHPNLLGVLDYEQGEGRPFYLTEFYGISLGELIGEGRRADAPSRVLRLDKAVHYMRQILDGLARLHYAGIVHRDIKPYNILICEDDTAKIADFGLSKLRGERMTTPSNLKVGSPFYAPPEQESEPDSVDFSADLYSSGVMLYRMLTGKLPCPSAPAPSRLNPDLDAGWNRFLEKATARNAAQRFSNAEKMREELDALEGKWKKQREQLCLLQEARAPAPSPAPKSGRSLRQVPVKARPAAARTLFGLDELWRPVQYASNDFFAESELAVGDRATGLVWQKGGSPYPMPWPEASAYVDSLNRWKVAGRSRWRLPTVNELITLLTATPHGADFCMASVFDKTQRWLWSADRCSFVSAWYVSAELGFVHHQDSFAPFYVRAVCG